MTRRATARTVNRVSTQRADDAAKIATQSTFTRLLAIQSIVGNQAFGRMLTRVEPPRVVQRVNVQPEGEVPLEQRIVRLLNRRPPRGADPDASGWTVMAAIQALIREAVRQDPRALDSVSDETRQLVGQRLLAVWETDRGAAGANFLPEIIAWLSGRPAARASSAHTDAAEALRANFCRHAAWNDHWVNVGHILRRHHARTFYDSPEFARNGGVTGFFPLSWTPGSLLQRIKAVITTVPSAAAARAIASRLTWFHFMAVVDGHLLTVSAELRRDGRAVGRLQSGSEIPRGGHPYYLRIIQFFPVGVAWEDNLIRTVHARSRTWQEFRDHLQRGPAAAAAALAAPPAAPQPGATRAPGVARGHRRHGHRSSGPYARR